MIYPFCMIIGITGTFGAGKGEIATYLESQGFIHYSVTSVITEELKRRSLSINRDTMLELANRLRKENGNAFFVKRIIEEIYHDHVTDAVIESIRVPEEAVELQSQSDRILIAVDADIQKRYQRITNRGSKKDDVSFEAFRQQEQNEMYGDNPSGTKIGECIEKADFTLINNGTLFELHQKVDGILHRIGVLADEKQNTYK